MPIEQTHEPRIPDAAQRAELVRRACIAWHKSAGAELPDARSAVKVHKGLVYVVLHGASGTLAVYRVRTDNGLLRRLRRWPAAVAAASVQEAVHP